MDQMQDWEEVLNSITLAAKPDVNGAEALALPTLEAPRDATVAKKAFYAEMQQEVEQRVSKRIVKRKKFDDEIVEAPAGRTNTSQVLQGKRQPAGKANAVLVKHTGGDKASKTRAIVSKSFFSSKFPPNPQPAKPQPKANRTKQHRLPRNFATKNLGRWKPVDDYMLIENVLQTNDLSDVHIGTIFSCDFTFQEIKARWTALLNNGSVSKTAAAAIRKMHPELKAAADRHILYSDAEEKALERFKSTDDPKLEDFQELLLSTNIFHASRTAKRLQKHWLGMKQYKLLPDQSIDPTLSFEEAEELLTLDKPSTEPNEMVEKEWQLATRAFKRKERLLQGQIAQLNVLIDAAIEDEKFSNTWDMNTLAALRGRQVYFLICAKEVSFGRGSDDTEVDMVLSLEGPTNKMSRRQGSIKFRSNGDFFICNEGEPALFVNGKVLVRGEKTKLNNNNVVDICGLSFVFLVNLVLIDKVRKQSATTTNVLS